MSDQLTIIIIRATVITAVTPKETFSVFSPVVEWGVKNPTIVTTVMKALGITKLKNFFKTDKHCPPKTGLPENVVCGTSPEGEEVGDIDEGGIRAAVIHLFVDFEGEVDEMPFRVVDVQLQIIRSIDGQQTDFASIKTPTRKGEETYLLKPTMNY